MKSKARCLLLMTGMFLLGAVAVRFLANSDHATAGPLQDDAALVKGLLDKKLSERTLDFATVAHACSGKRVLPLTADPAVIRRWLRGEKIIVRNA